MRARSRAATLSRWFLPTVCALVFGALPWTEALAAQLTFRWDYAGDGATGFKLYCGNASRVYPTIADVGNTDTYTLAGLAEGKTYYCAVTAYDSDRIESEYSEELSVSIPYAPPVAGFTPSATTGVAPLSVSFSNTTTGDVTAWAWKFGDGSTSTAKTPAQKVYNTPGNYTVELTATGRGGPNSTSKPISVSSPPPVANFTMTPASGAVPLTVHFTNSSTGSVASWAWDFGDGTSSSLQAPSKTYNAGGSYTVKLKAIGPGGSNTKTAGTPVVVTGPPVLTFTMTPASGTTPLAVTFNNTTTGSVTGWAWDFGDGTASTAKSPTKTYATAGNYIVKLTANWLGGKVTETASTPVTVNVPAPAPEFAPSAAAGTAPLTVAFTNKTSGKADTWVWDFGDGTKTSTVKSPNYTYRKAGSFLVKLTAIGPGGTVVKTATKPIVVNLPAKPNARFASGKTGGTTPLTVAFSNASTGQVDSWAWDFGDGTISTERSPTKVYSAPGEYIVKLTATGLGGASTVTATTPIKVTVPQARFGASPLRGSAPLAVRFSNTTAGQVAAWTWNFGDGESSTEKSPLHTFAKPGIYVVTLTATGVGGSSSYSSSIEALAPPKPVAKINPSTVRGYAPLAVRFYNATTGQVDSWAWDFGDGTTSTEKTPLHTFSPDKSYTVTLTATGLSGTSTATVTITALAPPKPVAKINPSTVRGYAPLAVRFYNATTGQVDSWAWDFGDGTTSTEKTPLHTFSPDKSYTVTLTATGLSGTSTATVTITALAPPKPVAKINPSTVRGYAPLAVRFYNATTGQVDSWAWDFGDGTTSTEKTPLHTFSPDKSYTVTLTATGLSGTSTATVTITALAPPKPVAKINPSTVRGYAPLAVRFYNATTGQVDSWAWDFGDGTTSTEKTPLHTFSPDKSYTVTLTATGLSGTSTATVTITALAPTAPAATFNASRLTGYAPLAVRFNNASTGQIHTWAWDFGDGTGSTEKSPLYTFSEPGIYTVTLTASGLSGSSSRSVLVNVLRPGLVAGYGFEEAGGSTAISVTGSSLNSAITAAGRSAAGKFGRALVFNGVNSWVSVQHTATLALTGGVTLQAWVFPAASMNGWRNVVMKEQPGGAVYELYANTSQSTPAGGVYTSAESLVEGGSLLPANQWSHVATTYDGTTQRLFVNGTQVASRAQPGPLKASSYPLRIGGNSVWGEYFEGLIDEVRIYNRALSASEVQADMAIPVVPVAQ